MYKRLPVLKTQIYLELPNTNELSGKNRKKYVFLLIVRGGLIVYTKSISGGVVALRKRSFARSK